MTDAEIEFGHCSGRQCKIKMHHMCFLQAHADDSRADNLGLYTRYCKKCWKDFV